MAHDFFRRGAELGADASALAAARGPLASGYLTYSVLLDPRKRVAGYRLGWRVAPGHEAADAATRLRSLVACVAHNLNVPGTGWRLVTTRLFIDVGADALLIEELQSLHPEGVVLCVTAADLAQPECAGALMFLREQGFGLMLCDADGLPEDADLRRMLTHVDVGDGEPERIERLRGAAREGRDDALPQMVATRMASWDDFAAGATRQVHAFVDGEFSLNAGAVLDQSLQPEAQLIVRLMRMIQRNEDVREIEATLKHDALLSYRLLRHINSPAIGVGVEIHSLRHAVAMLGYTPLFRWLSLLLATSNPNAGSPYMMKKAIMRGRFVELLGKGMLAAGDPDNLFVVGMFSLIDQLLGVPMHEVLSKVQLAESVQQAILHREGAYGPFLALAETCETDGRDAARLAEALFISPARINAAHLSAMAWAQDARAADMGD